MIKNNKSLLNELWSNNKNNNCTEGAIVSQAQLMFLPFKNPSCIVVNASQVKTKGIEGQIIS